MSRLATWNPVALPRKANLPHVQYRLFQNNRQSLADMLRMELGIAAEATPEVIPEHW